MYYLYGSKAQGKLKLVATFDSDQQLKAYVRWSTVSLKNGVHKFEQGSTLVGYDGWLQSSQPLSEDDAAEVEHNPSPSML